MSPADGYHLQLMKLCFHGLTIPVDRQCCCLATGCKPAVWPWRLSSWPKFTLHAMQALQGNCCTTLSRVCLPADHTAGGQGTMVQQVAQNLLIPSAGDLPGKVLSPRSSSRFGCRTVLARSQPCILRPAQKWAYTYDRHVLGQRRARM